MLPSRGVNRVGRSCQDSDELYRDGGVLPFAYALCPWRKKTLHSESRALAPCRPHFQTVSPHGYLGCLLQRFAHEAGSHVLRSLRLRVLEIAAGTVGAVEDAAIFLINCSWHSSGDCRPVCIMVGARGSGSACQGEACLGRCPASFKTHFTGKRHHPALVGLAHPTCRPGFCF